MFVKSRSPTVRKTCKVCRLPQGEREIVEGGILIGWSPRSIAARFSTTTRRDVLRHMQCVVATEPKEEECR